jgi:hypothetical protein
MGYVSRYCAFVPAPFWRPAGFFFRPLATSKYGIFRILATNLNVQLYYYHNMRLIRLIEFFRNFVDRGLSVFVSFSTKQEDERRPVHRQFARRLSPTF